MHSASFDAAARFASVSGSTVSAAYGYLANSPLVGNIFFTNGSALRMTTTKQYDHLNRLLSVASAPSASSALSFSYTHNLANQRIAVTNAEGSYWVYGYDSLGQVISGKRHWADGSPIAGQQNEYSFDDIGNRKTAKTGGDQWGANLRESDYYANKLNQYTNRTVPGFVQVLGSANSNAAVSLWADGGIYAQTSRKAEYYRGELAADNSSAPLWLTVTNLAVLQQGTSPDIAVTNVGHEFLPRTPAVFGYDADGNLTNDGRWSFTWDAENRLTKIESKTDAPFASKRKLEFTYDAQWRRTQKVVYTNSGSGYVAQYTNRFVYDGWNLVAILDSQSSILYSFTWGADFSGTAQGAGGVGGLLSMKVHSGSLAGTYFYTYDGNGNVAALVSAADGSIAAQYEYGPFGEVLRATGLLASLNPFLFSTKYYDRETGLYYYGFRYSDPDSGRWLRRDPTGEVGGLNLYGFLKNSPPNLSDFLGAWLQLYQDPESGIFGIADTYDVHYLGMHRAVVCGATVPNRLWWTGAPLEDSSLDMLGGNSLNMTFGPSIGTAIGAGSRQFPTLAAAAGITAQASAGLFLVVIPEPALSKVGGGMLLADAADNMQALMRGADDTLFGQAMSALPWMDEKSKKRACCVKSCSVMILAFATGPKANQPLKLSTADSWGKMKTLAGHFRDHGADFGSLNADQYANQASQFLQRAVKEKLPIKIDCTGVIRVYDVSRNEFGAFNPDGTTRTYYAPTRGEAYWNDQPGVPPLFMGE